MVFFHGGAYGWGGTTDPVYNGQNFAKAHDDVIIVTCNYRLGLMSFADFSKVEGDMIMSLAMANNFYGMDVTINDCYLNANNAAEYHYHVTAEGKEDTWIVNYNKRTVFFNNGNTEYSSDMMSDFSLGVWFTAIEEYYDYHPDRYPAQ